MTFRSSEVDVRGINAWTRGPMQHGCMKNRVASPPVMPPGARGWFKPAGHRRAKLQRRRSGASSPGERSMTMTPVLFLPAGGAARPAARFGRDLPAALPEDAAAVPGAFATMDLTS
jgi:hypothetical protein